MTRSIAEAPCRWKSFNKELKKSSIDFSSSACILRRFTILPKISILASDVKPGLAFRWCRHPK